MKYFLPIAVVLLLLPVMASGQKVAVKTNLLYDATATINLGTEIGMAPRWTLDVSGNANMWKFDDTQWRHYLVQPEVRYWLCNRFNGHFFGLHAHAAWYNVGGISFIDHLKHNRYQGYLYGAGVSYGYQWILGNRWNLEATVGGGFAILNHKKSPIADCGITTPRYKQTYWGVTKIGISLIYIIK